MWLFLFEGLRATVPRPGHAGHRCSRRAPVKHSAPSKSQVAGKPPDSGKPTPGERGSLRRKGDPEAKSPESRGKRKGQAGRDFPESSLGTLPFRPPFAPAKSHEEFFGKVILTRALFRMGRAIVEFRAPHRGWGGIAPPGVVPATRSLPTSAILGHSRPFGMRFSTWIGRPIQNGQIGLWHSRRGFAFRHADPFRHSA